MSGIFFTSPLIKTATAGASWDRVDAYFPELQVFANVLLSAYRTQTPERFSGFQPSWAEAYIVTPETPMTSVGFGISFPNRRDNTVFLKTDRMTFWLQVSNGSGSNPPASASAVGIIYDFATSARFDLASAEQTLELAVHDEDGSVVATHRSIRLEGGPSFDEDETRERVLAEAHATSQRDQGSLKIASFDDGQMPFNRHFRINPSTGEAEPLDEPTMP